ncbi:MAG TPA: LapA family protein [Thermodesulfovibrionales bacterium]|nr:LapA family protein [Thermodesulfovibrionales bacterium]
MLIIVLLLVIIILVSVFSVQNAVPVTLSFFLWRFEASLAIVIFLSVISGLITGIIIAILVRRKLSVKKETSEVARH